MAPYSFHGTARIEFDEAADYYYAEHRGLGLLFIDAVNRAVTQTREFPESCKVLRDRNRAKRFRTRLSIRSLTGTCGYWLLRIIVGDRSTGAGGGSGRVSNNGIDTAKPRQ